MVLRYTRNARHRQKEIKIIRVSGFPFGSVGIHPNALLFGIFLNVWARINARTGEPSTRTGTRAHDTRHRTTALQRSCLALVSSLNLIRR